MGFYFNYYVMLINYCRKLPQEYLQDTDISVPKKNYNNSITFTKQMCVEECVSSGCMNTWMQSFLHSDEITTTSSVMSSPVEEVSFELDYNMEQIAQS